MKTAKLHISVVEFTCPECGAGLPNEIGSFLFSVHELPDTVKCPDCGQELKVPERAKKLGD